MGETGKSASYARTSAALGGQYRKFFGASVAAVLLLQVTIVTDTIIVGQLLGSVPMSGVRVASPVVNILNVLGMLVGVGGATLTSIAIGRRDGEAADSAFSLSILLSIALGAAFALVVAPFAEPIASLISSDPTTVPYTATFLRIVAVASPVYILASVMALLLRADSCIKLSSVVLSMAGVANVAFDLLFMGALGMGVEGSAYATDCGMLVAVLLSLLYFRWPNRTLRLRRVVGRVKSHVNPAGGQAVSLDDRAGSAKGESDLAKSLSCPGKGQPASEEDQPVLVGGQAGPAKSQASLEKGRPAPGKGQPAPGKGQPSPAKGQPSPAKGQIGLVFKNGAPGALRMLFACIALLFLNYVVGNCVGVEGIAFLTVCGNIQLLAVAFFSGGGQAAIPMEGVLYGERDFRGLRLLVGYVFRVILLCVGALIVVIWLFPDQLVRLFVPEGIEGSDWLLRLYAIGFLPLALNYVMTYYYNTIQQRKIATTLTLCENLVLYLPLIWVLTNGLGLVGAVLAFVMAEVLALGVFIIMAAHTRRKLGAKNILLIPDVPREVVFEATVPVSNADAAGIAHAVKAALDECGVEELTAIRATMGVEEMVANAAISPRNKGRDVLFDIIVSDLPSCVQVSLRDNGAPFDPTDSSVDDEGIVMMLAVASRVQHSQTLGMNLTIIEVEKGTP